MNLQGILNKLAFSIFTLLAFIIVLPLQAQISEAVQPYPINLSLDFETIEVNLDAKKAETLDIPQNAPPLVGITTDVLISPAANGNWIVLPALQKKIWVLRIMADENSGISLYFDKFAPGTEGKLFIYDDMFNTYGAYTNISNPNGKAFAVQPIVSKSLIIQFETAINATDYSISINEVGLMFPDKSGQGFGTSGSCNVNVNCLEGQEWQRQKRGVARVIVKQGSAQFYCSGSLINNALANRFPYFLTANHCGEFSSETDYNQWIFDFNYESPDCANPLAEPARQTMTGAALVARAISGTSNGSDFKLLQLAQDVPLSYNPYFNGWSRQENTTTSGAGIHHPDGDIKKISTYTSAPVSSQYGYGGVDLTAKYWRVQWSPTENGHGITEGGSSGSPLFDANGRIIGLLTGGSSSCSNLNGPDFYGKFSSGWESNGNEAFNQLKPWLDPMGSDPEVIGGLGSDTLFVEADFNAVRNDISINQRVSFENLSSGTIESYQWSFPGGEPSSSTQEDPGQIEYKQYGDFDVELIVANSTIADTLLRKNYISVKPFLFPNPATGMFEMSFGVDLTEEPEISILNAAGQTVPFHSSLNGSRLKVQMYHAVGGTYVIRINDRFVEKTLKLIVIE